AGHRMRNAHVCLRRAHCIAYVMENRRPRIYEDELILGNISSKRVAANYYPEGASLNILEDLPHLDKRAIPLHLSGSEKVRLVRVALSTWRDGLAFRALLTPRRIRHLWRMLHAERYIVTAEAGVAHQAG